MQKLKNTPPILVFLALFIFIACKTGVKKDQPTTSIRDNTKQNMPITPLPGPSNYGADWKIVDSLQAQGLPKSAAEKVQAIYTRAQKDKNTTQIIKCLIYIGKYTATLEEDGFVKAVRDFEKAEQNASQPEKAILQSIIGQCYTLYLEQNRWVLNNRTPIADADRKGMAIDLQTAAAAQIEQVSLDYYAASISQEALLRTIPLTDMGELVIRGHNDSINGAPLRSNLWEFLADRAISHYSNERSFIAEPTYAFALDQEAALASADAFINARFESKDSSSGKWMTIRLYQRLLAATQASDKRSKHLQYDLSRLRFAYDNSVLPDKELRYENTLKALYEQHKDHPMAGEIMYRLYMDKVWSGYNDQDKGAGERNKQILKDLTKIIQQHPNTYGASLCQSLVNRLRQKNLNAVVEEVNLPNRPILISVSYKNLSRVHVRVVHANFNPEFWDNVNYDERWNKLQSLLMVQQRSWDVQDPGDCLEHRTELSLEGLPFGKYWVMVCENEQFDRAKGFASFADFAVSNLSVSGYSEQSLSHFVVANRETGTPIAGVKLNFFNQRWDNNRHRNQFIGSSTTDPKGFAKADIPQNTYVQVLATLGEDSLWVGNASHGRYYEDRSRRPQVQFFTDRSLYRPGQTVYFKGVMFQNDDKNRPQILENQATTAIFYDANGQEKGRLSLRTNEYGSFNGAFTAPASGLTGQMSIRCDNANGGAYFNVEEYKRPKFEVSIKPITGEYRIGDKITVNGEAKNYAGNVVDGAKVQYRVVRMARYPFWDYGWWFRGPSRASEEREITNGTASTDENGQFNITFEAIPDQNIPKKDQPVFDYRVTVDVTDINGETRSGDRSVSAGYVALQVDWELPAEINVDSLKNIGLKTTNWSGEKMTATGDISIQKLVEPKQHYLKRYWDKPDLPVIKKADFDKLFPNFAWQDEDNPEKWDRQDFTRNVKFNTNSTQNLNLYDGKVSPGYYLMRLTTQDKYGEKIEIQRIVRVYNSIDPGSKFYEPKLLTDKPQYEPGETAQLELGAKDGPQPIFFAIEREGKLKDKVWLSANPVQFVPISITEEDRGGIVVHAFAVRNNRYYSIGSHTIQVPWSNKELNISFESFRDKLQPGDQEEWRLKISGPKKEKVAAEMVAAMYDASLDQFKPHDWGRIGFPSQYARCGIYYHAYNASYGEQIYPESSNNYEIQERILPTLNWFDFLSMGYYERYLDTVVTFDPETYEEKVQVVRRDMPRVMSMPAPAGGELKAMKAESIEGDFAARFTPPVVVETPAGKNAAPPAPIRRNLNETVFFFPEVRTDKDGNMVLKFKMNEALTRWKLLTFAHTKALQQAISTREVVTQKELMILANAPRFLRAGDDIVFGAKVSNLSAKTITGKATLNLLDANTLQPVEQAFGLNRTIPFEVKSGQSAPLSWKLKVPENYTGAVTWQIFADGNNFRDGEESTLPVVTNRMLVTETLPMSLRGNQTKNFVFDNLKNAPTGSSLVSHNFSLEFTSNPVWYAVQALPYLMEYPHECSEQVFSRFYANTLAQSVTQKLPQIRRVFERWKDSPNALASNLSKNQELKYALLEETPWVVDAQNEAAQKQNIALLFDLNRMANERERALNTLSERQGDDGGFSWFPGGNASWYITQYIYSGLGHLARLGAIDLQNDPKAADIWQKSASYCTAQVEKAYRDLEYEVQKGRAKFEDDHLHSMVIQYLYARNLVQGANATLDNNILNYYLGQAEKYWLGKGLYQEGLLALGLQGAGRTDAAKKIANSLRERAIVKEELGMYWPHDRGYFWYQLPIETQALMIEVFQDVAKDARAVEDLRIWLLKNKQTNRWESTKATSEAIYALLLDSGAAPEKSWLNNSSAVQVTLGGKTLKPTEYEAGTGYFKQSWAGKEVKSSWANVKVENPNSNIVWGSAYWQYFEDLDKIKTFQKTPLTIVKELFKEENSPNGPILTRITENNVLKRGDKVKVRIEIRVDREMEFVHLKDMRAAGFEPVNVLSGYRWQGGLGYYESTKDLATHFFIEYLPKGTFVFEYQLVVSHQGDMSNGITTMQCMYAPEFTSHSKGIRVKVE